MALDDSDADYDDLLGDEGPIPDAMPNTSTDDAPGFVLGRVPVARRTALANRPDEVVHFRRLVRLEARKRGVSLDSVFWSIFVGLAMKARTGDVPAARLLLERVAVPEDPDHLMALSNIVDPAMPPPEPDESVDEALDGTPQPPMLGPAPPDDNKTFAQHLAMSMRIASERGLLDPDQIDPDEAAEGLATAKDFLGEE